jgi:hypothetical protein
VTQELNLISKAQPPNDWQAGSGTGSQHPLSDPYGRLLKLLDYTAPVIDVLTGTSAGGINAAALAVAQANRRGDIGVLKPLWLADAQIESMLQIRSGQVRLHCSRATNTFCPCCRTRTRWRNRRTERSNGTVP